MAASSNGIPEKSRKRGPLHFDDNRYVDQLAHLVPQIHLTLTSILQGGALIFLLSNVRLPALSRHSLPHSLQALLDGLAAHDLYLPYVVSFMLIVIVWNQFTLAAFELHWPLSALSTAYQFLISVFEIAMFSSVNDLGPWLFWLGAVTLIGALIRRRNSRLDSPSLFPTLKSKEHTKRYRQRSFDAKGPWYMWTLTCILCPLGVLRWLDLAVFEVTVTPTVALGPVAVRPFHIIDISIVVTLVVAGYLIMKDDDRYFFESTEEVLAEFDSMYQMLPNGKIQERP